jgi:hypothetical protein
MNKEKLRAARRSGFIYGLFRASPIPTELLSKNLAKEAFDQMNEKAPKTLDQMRHRLKVDMGLHQIGFIPNKEKTEVKMIYQPWKRPEQKEPGEGKDELVIEPELYIDLEEPELHVEIDKKMRNKQRKKNLKKAQAEYYAEQERKAASANSYKDEARRLYDVFR